MTCDDLQIQHLTTQQQKHIPVHRLTCVHSAANLIKTTQEAKDATHVCVNVYMNSMYICIQA